MTNLNFTHVKRSVLIRSLDYLRDRDIDSVFIDKKYENKKYPLYYQYCQKNRVVEPDVSDLIGYVTNIRVDENDNVVCDVEWNPLLSNSIHIMGVIDNYVIKHNKDKRGNINYELIRFVVYNKDFKQKVEEKIMREQETQNTNQEEVSVCMEIAAAESIPELNVEAPKANTK